MVEVSDIKNHQRNKLGGRMSLRKEKIKLESEQLKRDGRPLQRYKTNGFHTQHISATYQGKSETS